MEKELEELDKTTDILKAFKSRVGEEDKTEDIGKLMAEWRQTKKINKEIKPDYSEDKLVEPVYEDLDKLESVPLVSTNKKSNMDLGVLTDDKTLELSDIESDKTIQLDEDIDIKEELNNVLAHDNTDSYQHDVSDTLEQQLQMGLENRKRQKKYGIRLALVSLIFVPCLITLIIIATHSNELITKNIFYVLAGALGIVCGLIVIGCLFWIKNIRINIETKTKKIFKYMYIFFMMVYTTLCVIFLVLLYGPSNEFKEWVINTSMATEDSKHYCTWFYSDAEIEEVLTNEISNK